MAIWKISGLHMSDITAMLTIKDVGRLFAVWCAYRILVALYNISPLHPLSHIPGPKLAAMTLAYEGWFDLIKVGRYTREIQKMHEEYGSLVRISPSEIHCNDPTFVDEIYAGGGRKRAKTQLSTRALVWPLDTTGFGTTSHDLHRARRAPLVRHFSRQQIQRLESDVHARLQFFCDKLLALGRRGGEEEKAAFDITMAYSCFTADVISGYSFGEPLGLLAQDGWEPNWRQALYANLGVTYPFKFLPFLRRLVVLGEFLARRGWMGPNVGLLVNTLQVLLPQMISKARMDAGAAAAAADNGSGGARGGGGLFADILSSEALPESEKAMPRMAGEGMILLNAGTETTSWTLAVVTFHMLSKPQVLDRLNEELRAAVPYARNLSWASLEKLPFLNAVIMEGLRLSYGISARSPRIAEEEDLVYSGLDQGGNKIEYVIPRGWAVGMSTALAHHNEDLFPNSHEFVPERWIDKEGNRRPDLEKHIMSFSKGSRQCVGINLAYCELYLAVAALALRVFPRMKLYETTVADVAYDHDVFVPMVKKGSKGVRVTIS